MVAPFSFQRLNKEDQDLFVFEIANNHQGSVSHGLKLIREVARVCEEFAILGAIKFQLRSLDSFIHRDFKNCKNTKHIHRFESTQLREEELSELERLRLEAIVAQGKQAAD